jgi:hypothetical protein
MIAPPGWQAAGPPRTWASVILASAVRASCRLPVGARRTGVEPRPHPLAEDLVSKPLRGLYVGRARGHANGVAAGVKSDRHGRGSFP